MKPIKVGMISLGCAKNQVDSERMLSILEKNDIKIMSTADESDVIIINTCGFIEDAKKEAIENILDMAKLKNEKTIKKIIVTGCLAERYKEEIKKEIPEIDGVLGTGSYDDIAEAVKKVMEDEEYSSFKDKNEYMPVGDRILTTPPYMGYLKIAEGCDNKCTYCAIPQIRGKFRSIPMEELIRQAKVMFDEGVKELCVIAQDSSRYGEDLYGEYSLSKLLKELCKIDFKWIRVLYLYPDKVTDELIDVIAEEEKIVKYIEMPLQHINNDVLQRMNRKGTKEEIIKLISKIRKKIPGVAIRSTFIVGFPGETDEEFSELLEFIKDARLERVGAFKYSPEEGTKAFDMDNQVDENIKEKRLEVLMSQQQIISDEINNSQIGKTFEVLVEGFDRYAEVYYGRSYMDTFEIDGKVFFSGEKKIAPGDIVKVKILDVFEYDLMGEIL